jgi:hypothetical protein
MNRFLMRLSMVLMAFSFTGCHSWQPDHDNCDLVGDTHYTPSDTMTTSAPPRMTSTSYIPSSQLALGQLAYHSLVPVAEAGMVPLMGLEQAVAYAVAMQRHNQAIAIADQFIVLANNARAAGQAAEAAGFMEQASIWESRALWHGTRSSNILESMLGLPVRVVAGLHVLLPSQHVLDQWMQGNFGYYEGMYYDDQASNRGYDHMQGVGILDGWLAGRHGGSGGDSDDDGDVCEYDAFKIPQKNPKADDPCNDHRKGALFPRTEEPTGTFTLQALLSNAHYLSTVRAMGQHQILSDSPMAMVYEAKVNGRMEFSFIRTFTVVWPDGFNTTYYQDPSSGEMIFAFGAEINGQFVDLETGEAYGEMFPGQAEVTTYIGDQVYGINFQ